MQLLLLQSVPGIGEQFEIVEVSEDTALDILAKRQALRPTMSVLKRFEGRIRCFMTTSTKLSERRTDN